MTRKKSGQDTTPSYVTANLFYLKAFVFIALQCPIAMPRYYPAISVVLLFNNSSHVSVRYPLSQGKGWFRLQHDFKIAYRPFGCVQVNPGSRLVKTLTAMVKQGMIVGPYRITFSIDSHSSFPAVINCLLGFTSHKFK